MNGSPYEAPIKPSRRHAVALTIAIATVTLVAAPAGRFVLRGWINDFDSAIDNGWKGKGRTEVSIWYPPPDNTWTIDGYDSTWSRGVWLDSDRVIAIKWDEQNRVERSGHFWVNYDDPAQVRITPVTRENP